jgi:VanZ family protein
LRLEFHMDLFKNEQLWLYLPLLIWIGVIFYFSSGRGSFSRTLPYFVPLLKLFFPHSEQTALENRFLKVRKIFHFVGYAVLALLASVAFSNSSLELPARFWHLFSFAVVLVVASIDEFRQSFNPSRVGSFSDVVLDCIGGLAAILSFWTGKSVFSE